MKRTVTKGQFISKCRQSRGSNQQMLAAQMCNIGKKYNFSVAPSTISNWEADRSSPNTKAEKILCQALGIRQSTLAKYNSPAKPKTVTETVKAEGITVNVTISK